jgi:Zn-dependent protease with chaperone function
LTVVNQALAGERWKKLSADERETFFSAIARHRRASWRVTGACGVAVGLLALVVAILMSPLLYCLIGLAFDAANLWRPAPDLLGWLGHQLDAVFSAKSVAPAALIQVGIIVSLPGIALMAALAYALRRVWLSSPLFDGGAIQGRAPDRTVLAEQRLANVVEEMAIAAGTPVPRIVIVPGGVNAAACGRDEAHVTFLVGEAMAASVSREQLEGMIAHLIGSVVDGDMLIGVRVTTTLSLFGVLARVGSSFTDQHALRYVASLWRVFLAPTSPDTLALLATLTDPFDDSSRPTRATQHAGADSGLTWREWTLMPLMGPVVLTGFLAGLVTQFFLEPLVAWAWRERKYMADATAVQLTRDPDALGGALASIESGFTGITAWTAHLAVAAVRGRANGPFGQSLVPIFPPIEKRVAALNRMGAHTQLEPRRPMPTPLVVLFAVLLSICGALMAVVVFLLVMVSTAISGLFTIFPATLLHFLLRWAGR